MHPSDRADRDISPMKPAVGLLSAALADDSLPPSKGSIWWSRHPGEKGEWFRMYVDIEFSITAGAYTRLKNAGKVPKEAYCLRKIALLKVKVADSGYNLKETWLGDGYGDDGFEPPEHRGTCIAKIETDSGKMDYEEFKDYLDVVEDYLDNDANMDETEVLWVDDAFA